MKTKTLIIAAVCAVLLAAPVAAHPDGCKIPVGVPTTGWTAGGPNGALVCTHDTYSPVEYVAPHLPHPETPAQNGGGGGGGAGAAVIVGAVVVGVFVLPQVLAIPPLPLLAKYDDGGNIYTGTEWDALDGKLRFGVAVNDDNADEFAARLEWRLELK